MILRGNSLSAPHLIYVNMIFLTLELQIEDSVNKCNSHHAKGLFCIQDVLQIFSPFFSVESKRGQPDPTVFMRIFCSLHYM